MSASKLNFVCLLVVICALAAGFLYGQYQGWRIFVITSGSMRPTINPGSVVITQPKLEYQPNQIVVHKQQAYLNADKNKSIVVTHRIISSDLSENGWLYQTQGDANSARDQIKIKSTDIIGRVICIVPYLGLVFSWIYQSWQLILFVIFLIGLIGYWLLQILI